MPKRRKHVARNVVEACLSNVWAIEPGKLHEITAFLELRAAGGELSGDEIRRAMDASQPLADAAIAAAFGVDSPDDENDRFILDGVEILSLLGTLAPRMNLLMEFSGGTSTQQFAAQFDRAMGDDNVRAILIDVDSPGGVVSGTEELRQKLFAARGVKPIVAIARNLVASAAYYVASGAERFVATPSTEVGSVGVYMIHRDIARRAENEGVAFRVFRSGRVKAAGNPYETLTDERAAVLQSRVDGPYRQMIGSIAENRGVDVATVEERFGQGGVFLAGEALRRGMIDAVATLEETVAELRAQISSERGPRGARRATNRDMPARAGAFNVERSEMNKRIKAALYALGYVDTVEATDDVCRAVLAGIYGAADRIPEDNQVIEDLRAGSNAAHAAATSLPAANVQAAHDREVDEARTAAAGAERQRVDEIMARADLLGSQGFAIDSIAVQAAIRDGLTPAEAVDRWTSDASRSQRGVGRVEPSASEVDTFQAAATAVLAQRLRPTNTRRAAAASAAPLPAAARDLQFASMSDIVRHDLRLSNVNLHGRGTAEDIASQWLAQGGNYGIPAAMEGSAQHAAQFPSLLSALVGKMLDQALELADATYPEWTGRMPDVADLKPQLIVAAGGLDRLDQLGDDEAAKQLNWSEETPGWIQIGRYGNKVGLTAVMVANDDLDAFAQGLAGLAQAHERTLNHLCLAIVAGNETLLDGYALFDNTNHGNDITSGGGAPSATQASAMKLKHRKQTGIGGVGYVRTPPAIALVPSTHEDAAEQTFLSIAFLAETKQAATDANVNVHRGRIVPIVEPDLEDYSSDKWYTFADPMRRRVIVHAFQRGYGMGGRRTSWFDDDTETRYVRLEGRFAAAAAGYRGAVRNSGTA